MAEKKFTPMAPMRVVLVSPQIPQNTGSIARSCAALKVPLHIIEPIPFEISERSVRRAGLDYWPLVDINMHESWDSFVAELSPKRFWCLSTKGKTPYFEANFEAGDTLVFGSETTGLGEAFLAAHPPTQILQIPMIEGGVRSLNLSNAVSVVLYEAYRQLRW